MLHRDTVSADLLELLGQLMEEEAFAPLRLVGGTALALQIGHRNSVDIDLFGKHEVDVPQLTQLLNKYKTTELLRSSKSIRVYLINGIKVDIVNYSYPWLAPALVEEGIRMAAVEDIAAMKIAAITQRGSKKDFIDLYFLLQEFSLSEILTFYQKKIADGNTWMALRSLAYFEDADLQPMPAMVKELKWNEIKHVIRQRVSEYGGL